MSKIQQVVDYYLSLTGKENTEYKKHLRAAKELLELCDGNVLEAQKMLDRAEVKSIGDWSIYFAVKKCILQEL